ncbi:orf1a polyprotein [Xenorhabdus stockiae]|uniref:Orf1a polyprotein n=1 Tax=Xenorhabdus stockiae TaxID=351614 RepID=A0A2D0KN96_9GAMM|nr:O-acetyl-ADP-ribose deacetylase [Xenorhabdus stockiae]PHM64909.1 orf1a polyprotein [Xenorhabdus stockiae]
MKNRIKIIHGDITKIAVEAIVNAANSSLLGGGGVDGAIHRAGGKAILEECMQIRAKQGGCDIGDAVITGAGNLPAKYVIHTVGPCWNGGTDNEPELLKKAYVSCFDLIEQYNIETVSFPNISTGIYRFPKKLAAEIALEVIHSRLFDNQNILQVNLICFDDENYDIYRSLN